MTPEQTSPHSSNPTRAAPSPELPGGAGERRRPDETKRFGGLEVEYRLVLGRRLHRQVGPPTRSS